MGLRILVVDDDVDILAWIKLEFDSINGKYEIITSESGNRALELFMQHRFDFVLSDISMEGMDGYELFNKIRQLDEDIPIAMMTAFGYDPNHVVVNAVKEGLEDILFKPFDIEDLFSLIEKRT